MNQFNPKPKTCSVCERSFIPARTMQSVCSPRCAAKKVKDAKKAEREETKRRKESVKSRAEWLREAQAAFNSYVRYRDHHLPCISCGRHHTGQWHAGHYLSRGARPELAFHPDNCHKQCAPCNTHLSGNLVLYRVNLIERIGLDRVEWLEGPHDPLKLTIPDIKEIRDIYKARAAELAKTIQNG